MSAEQRIRELERQVEILSKELRQTKSALKNAVDDSKKWMQECVKMFDLIQACLKGGKKNV